MRCQLGLFACGLCLLAVFARTAAAQQQISAAEPTSAEIGSLFVAYPEAISGISDLYCGFKRMDNYFTLHIAGIDLEEYPEGCGKCIKISCLDKKFCSRSPVDDVTLAVVDNCEGCGRGVVSTGSFVPRELAGTGIPESGFLNITWEYTDCRPYGRVWGPTSNRNVATAAAVEEANGANSFPKPQLALGALKIGEILAENLMSRDSKTASGEETMTNDFELNVRSFRSSAEEGEAAMSIQEIAPAPNAEVGVLSTNTDNRNEASAEDDSNAVLATLADQALEIPAVILPWEEAIPENTEELSQEVILEEIEVEQPAPEMEGNAVISTKPLPAPQVDVKEIIKIIEESANVADKRSINTQSLAPAPEEKDDEISSTKELNKVMDTPEDMLSLVEENDQSRTKSRPADPTPDPKAFAVKGKAILSSWGPLLEDDLLRQRACGLGTTSEHFKENFVAVQLSKWPKETSACGDCVAIRCIDSSACPNFEGQEKELIAQVVDQCGNCGNQSLLINSVGMKNLIGEERNNGEPVQVEWYPTSCRSHTDGSLFMDVDPQGNEYWQSIVISNSAQPIREIYLNADKLKSMGYNGRWVWKSLDGKKLDMTMPMRVSVRGADGRVVGTEIAIWKSQYLGTQL